MALTKDYRLGEFTFPRGWFMIAESAELESQNPLAVRYFGKDFALYRGKATGKVVLLDAYCPHMKTHLAAPNKTSYVVLDRGGSNLEGDAIRCPYHAWRFGADGKCDDIPYHQGPIPAAACVKSWTVKESMGAIWVWHDPEGGEPQWEHPWLSEWDDSAWVRWQFDRMGVLNQHPQEVCDNIADCSHLGPIHGSVVQKFENEFQGHTATQRQCGPHRTLVGANGVQPVLHTLTTYHGPGVLISNMSGMFESIILITHTPIEDGSIKVWHALMVKSPSGNAIATSSDTSAARQFQEASRLAFAQDFEVWIHKAPCINGLFLPSDGAFMKQRLWYKQFYNPLAKQQEFLDQCEGVYLAKGIAPYTEKSQTV